MSEQTAILERPQTRRRKAEFAAEPLGAGLAEDDVDDNFEQEPSDALLHLFDNSLIVVGASLSDEPRESSAPVFPVDDTSDIGRERISNLLSEPANNSRTTKACSCG